MEKLLKNYPTNLTYVEAMLDNTTLYKRMIIKENQDEFYQYTTDQANLVGSCDKVFIIKDSKEVAEVVLNANELNMPITVCGNHTSLTGASLPESGWVIATERLNNIIEINEDEMFAIVEPGIMLSALQHALAPLGLYFPPDPTEDSCFVGGMISTNASGARSFNFGPTRNFIEALNVVLPTGEEISISRNHKIVGSKLVLDINNQNSIEFDIPDSYVLPTVKNSAGYFLKPGMSLIDLFIGSEGTLGIVTQAKLKLKKIPKEYISMVIFFDQLNDCFSCINKLRIVSKETNQLDTTPNVYADAIEFFDKNSLNLLRDKFPVIPANAVAALWVEYGVHQETSYNLFLNEWEIFFLNENIDLNSVWFGADNNDRAKIKEMRHALPVIVNDIIKKRGVRKLGTDIAVPHHLFEDFYSKVIHATEAKKLQYVMFGHFGDSHMHLNLLPANNEEICIAKELYDYLCKEAIECGGTFSAEHGVGKLKCDYLKLMVGETNYRFLKEVKNAFDPQHILGIGTLFKDTFVQ